MKPKLFLRVAAGLLIFHLIGHSFGLANWKHATVKGKQMVIDQMNGPKFPFMGSDRAMGDYYEGFGYCASIALLFFATILWHVSNSLYENKDLTFKITMTTSICLFFWSIDEFLFFFPFAAGITLLAAVSTLISIIQLRNKVVLV